MTKYDAFFNEFKNFSDHEIISDFNIQSKITLFGVYCDTMSRRKQDSNANKSRYNRNQATNKQLGLIQSLIKKGHLDDQDLSSLSKKAASDLIEEGIRNQKSNTRVNNDQENSGEFAGSYDHGDTDGGLF